MVHETMQRLMTSAVPIISMSRRATAIRRDWGLCGIIACEALCGSAMKPPMSGMLVQELAKPKQSCKCHKSFCDFQLMMVRKANQVSQRVPCPQDRSGPT